MKTCVKVGKDGFYSEGVYPVESNQLAAIIAERLLLVKCNDNKMVNATLQLGHLTVGSASGA